MACPNRLEGWRTISDKFYGRSNLPHTLGTLDGKHVASCSPESVSLYFNDKGFYSINLMGLVHVDADYKFIWADVGGS